MNAATLRRWCDLQHWFPTCQIEKKHLKPPRNHSDHLREHFSERRWELVLFQPQEANQNGLAPLWRSSHLFRFYVNSTLNSGYLIVEMVWTFFREPTPGNFTSLLDAELTFKREAWKSTTDKSCMRSWGGGGSLIRGRDSARFFLSWRT